MLPMLPESILYFMHALFGLVPNSGLENITDLTLSNLRYTVFTESRLLFLASFLALLARPPHLS